MKRLNQDVQKSIKQVQKLAAYRDEYVRIKQKSPRFQRACQITGVSAEIVERHLPELVEKWYDTKYYWSTTSNDASIIHSDVERASES